MHCHETIHTGLMTADELIERGISFVIPGGAQLGGLRGQGKVLRAEYYLCSHEVIRPQNREARAMTYSFKPRRAGFWDSKLHPNIGYTVRVPTKDGTVRMHLEMTAACRPIGSKVPDTPAKLSRTHKDTGTPVMI